MGLPEFANSGLQTSKTDSGLGEISLLLENGDEIEAVCLSMGNPHCVIFVDDMAVAPLSSLGPAIERHELFPSRTNVEFVQIVDLNHLKIRVWERGVGETASCGSGACAAFAAALQTGRGNSPMLATLSGGDLSLRVDDYGHVFMTGPAVEVYYGELCFYFND
jgi:diaminopimelate epimerase